MSEFFFVFVLQLTRFLFHHSPELRNGVDLCALAISPRSELKQQQYLSVEAEAAAVAAATTTILSSAFRSQKHISFFVYCHRQNREVTDIDCLILRTTPVNAC